MTHPPTIPTPPGTTEASLYGKLLSHDLWKTRREGILARDGHRCRHCGSTEQPTVHHRQYHIDAVTGIPVKPWDYADRYLVTLCASCHDAGHERHPIPTFHIQK
jgi:5-methylcytosine-specific restriction endonuclease McrA